VKLNVEPLKSALNQLETSISYLHSDLAKKDKGLYAQFRNSAIQCFEFTYELSYKMVRRQLDQIVGTTEELRQMNFADLIRTAADSGLVPDVKRFLRYRERRNLTSHTYDEKKADEIINILDDFVNDIHFLLKELSIRNAPN
jgi:nucleotidyltransferase substrate binding protein (TIGR01987 family)